MLTIYLIPLIVTPVAENESIFPFIPAAIFAASSALTGRACGAVALERKYASLFFFIRNSVSSMAGLAVRSHWRENIHVIFFYKKLILLAGRACGAVALERKYTRHFLL